MKTLQSIILVFLSLSPVVYAESTVNGMNLGNGLDPAIMTNYGATQNGVGSFPVIDCLCREQRQHQNFWVDHNWIPYTSGEVIAAWKKMTP